ncbi:ABC-type multidrug transport system, permease protein [Candidatus Gastranaerophilus sp. (ex Termes propinquus)]|nr:ABC-type multidrug transport system, permease protein [Candidatus Gastranaerophilus sp. (ex Termes propinquus)]GBF23306.1 ABC-type multidrug transport system, permease protein [Candidatus Gastranaerophilus sp. (ex Termes propinquus)]
MNLRVLLALTIKEFYQLIRDPSVALISFGLPFLLLSIYMYGVNIDTIKVTVGLKIDDNNPEVANLLESFSRSKFVNAVMYNDKYSLYHDLTRSKIHAFVIVPNDFIRRLDRGDSADITVIGDGSEINLAKYSTNYTQSIVESWLLSSPKYQHKVQPRLLEPQVRQWYNQDIRSQNFILPGSIATTMTILGMLLTALVVSREWERGTMEALLATSVRKIEFILSKYIPYFVIGMLSMLFSVVVSVLLYEVPFVGSYFILFLVSALFLLTSLGFGLLISVSFKEQFLSSQAALGIGFMPALFLSGLLFPIASMPEIIQFFTTFIPTRYFVSAILSEFMAGTVWEIVLMNSFYLGMLDILLFVLVYRKMKMRLD